MSLSYYNRKRPLIFIQGLVAYLQSYKHDEHPCLVFKLSFPPPTRSSRDHPALRRERDVDDRKDKMDSDVFWWH